ncbi:MAG: hypothetical protein H7123_06920 [Thermoleophilia bacterium]|nr:hypothetical protein [Thermoleophilia bacterium]
MTISCLLGVMALLTGCGSSNKSSKASSGGTGGSGGCGSQPSTQKKLDGLSVMHHCGNGQASITFAGSTYTINGGNCQKDASYLAANMGNTVVDTSASAKQRAKIDYLGVLVGRSPAAGADAEPAGKDGTYTTDLALTAAVGGKIHLLTNAKLTLSGNRSKGTFEGTDLQPGEEAGGKLTGTFDCG